MPCLFAISIVGVLFLSLFSSGSSLAAIRTNGKLPITMVEMSLSYDGVSDFIYLLGGFGAEEGPPGLESILRFDISTETVENIGTMPNPGYSSPVAEDSKGNIVYINGDIFHPEVYKLSITDNSVTTVGALDFSAAWSASAKNSAGKVLVFGGIVNEDKIVEVDIEAETVQSQTVGKISERYVYVVSAELSNNSALVCGVPGRVPCLMLDLETLESRNVTPNSFPGFRDGMTVANVDEFVYFFGGNFSSTPADGIIRLELATNSWEFIPVEGFPAQEGLVYVDAPEVVWVEKQNRIYMFGGQLLNNDGSVGGYLDEIWYIDLNPTNKTTSPDTRLY